MFNSKAKEAAFDTVLRSAAAEGSNKCQRSDEWIAYAREQVQFYDTLVKAPALMIAVSLVAAIVLVVLDTDATRGAAIGAGVLGLLGAAGLFAVLKGLASGAQDRLDKAEAARPADCP